MPEPERRLPERRSSDKRLEEVLEGVKRVVKLVAVIGGVLLLGVAVASTVAIVGADNAQEAANKANTAARTAGVAIARTERNSAKLRDLCQIARRQRKTLVLSLRNSEAYLESPAAAGGPPGLNAFIRAFSLPQLRARIRVERVPPSCRRARAPRPR